MKNLIIGTFLALALLTGCSQKSHVEPTPTQVVQVTDIAPLPDSNLMQRKEGEREYLTPGISNGEASAVFKNNNIRAQKVEIQRDQLQEYICTIFKPSIAGPICNK